MVEGSGYPINLSLDRADVFPADGEELAEGGVEGWLHEVSPYLLHYGVSLDVSTDDSSDDDMYSVQINGRRCLIWAEPDQIDWYHATVAPLAVVNDLLAEADAAVRCYTLYTGGNEGMLLILNPQVPALMRASELFEDQDLPALAAS